MDNPFSGLISRDPNFVRDGAAEAGELSADRWCTRAGLAAEPGREDFVERIIGVRRWSSAFAYALESDTPSLCSACAHDQERDLTVDLAFDACNAPLLMFLTTGHFPMHRGQEPRDRHSPLRSDPKRSGYLADGDQAISRGDADAQLLGGPGKMSHVLGERGPHECSLLVSGCGWADGAGDVLD